MNTVILTGRLTADPKGTEAYQRFTLAVDRPFKKEGEDTADFIRCVAFGVVGQSIAKWFSKGSKIGITGRIQTGSYEKDGAKWYTTDVVVNTWEFGESKKNDNSQEPPVEAGEYMEVPKNVADDLPFKK